MTADIGEVATGQANVSGLTRVHRSNKRSSRVARPLISIVISTKNNADTLPRLLRSIENQSYAEKEVIVVDNASTDSTLMTAAEHHCIILSAFPERSAQRNAGARKARGDLLLFLDSDMELARGILEECLDVARDADGLCLGEITIGNGYWARARAFERARYFRSEIFEAARCFWRDTFEALGGYDPRLTGLEDYDLHARLMQAGFRLGWVDGPLLHHEEGLTLFEYLRKRAYYGRSDGRYAARHPQRWREQRSPIRRMRYVLGGHLRLADLSLLPGLVLMRGLELVARIGFG
jgi:glycosyltransferase involved in cell wall biosynthesis